MATPLANLFNLLLLLASLLLLEKEVHSAGIPRGATPALAPVNGTSSVTSRMTYASLPDYDQFHANGSLIGRPVPCSGDEKICFRYNLVFDPQLDKCVPVGRGGAPGACDARVGQQEFESGSGHVRGYCSQYKDPCPGYRMAYDGRCYRKEVVRDVICGCAPEPTPHFLRGVESRCSPAAVVRIDQPDVEGLCLVPDLRFPDLHRFAFVEDQAGPLSADSSFDCSEAQRKCVSQGQLWVEEGSGCYDILERGPCGEDYVVVLKGKAVLKGLLEATCVPARGGCPPGEKFMLYDGRGHADRELDIAFPAYIFQNAAGYYGALNHARGLTYTFRLSKSRCVFSVRSNPAPPINKTRLKPPYASDNIELFSLYDVPDTSPTADLRRQ